MVSKEVLEQNCMSLRLSLDTARRKITEQKVMISDLNDINEKMRLDIASANLDNNPHALCSTCDHLEDKHFAGGNKNAKCYDGVCKCVEFEPYVHCQVCGHSEHDHHTASITDGVKCVVGECGCEDFESQTIEVDES